MKHSIKLISLAVVLGLASTQVHADQDWQDTAKDAWIDGKAEATLLFNGNLDSFDINTDVENGVVRLSGEVDTEVDKDLAEELVANIDGVKEVDNRLTVSDPEDGTSEVLEDLNDAKIATVIKTRLLFEGEVSGSDIDVDAKDGVVTLKGKVDTDAERDLAVAIAENTDDVKDVIAKIDIIE